MFLSCESKQVLPPKTIIKHGHNEISLGEFQNQTKDGDLVLKMGYGSISKIIATQLDEETQLSHCGVIYKKNDSVLIIHSVSGEIGKNDGVQAIDFENFYDDVKPKSLIILRHKDSSLRSIISAKAKDLLDLKVPFDHDFDLSNSDKLYCSEFVEIILKDTFAKSYFKTKSINGTKIYTFNSILNSDDFEIFKYQK